MKLFSTYDLRSYPMYSIDLIQDGMGGSLKEFEGYLGLNIEESKIPFNINRKLTTKELEETLSYCHYDVDATIELFKHRMGDIKAKMDLLTIFGLDKSYLDKTNAQLAAAILQAKPVETNDELEPFDFNQLDINLRETKGYVMPVGVDDFVKNADRIISMMTLEEYFGSTYDYDTQLIIEVVGVIHIVRFGGLHGAINNFIYEGELWVQDVESYYPSMMIVYDFISRAIPEKLKGLFNDVYVDRLNAKHTNDKRKSNALKLFINTVYGAMKAKFNELFDPHNSNNVCVSGQLMLIDLLEDLEPYITLVQSNTDGIVFIPHNKMAINMIVSDWEKRTKMNMELTKCSAIYQKDVNNYILVHDDKSIEVKGAFVKQTTMNGHRPRDLRRTGKIIDDAVVNYFVNNVPVRDTVMNCHELLDFQLIRKTGRSYDETVIVKDGVDIPIQKVNRLFATIDSSWGQAFKVRHRTMTKPAKRDRYQSLPPHCALANDMQFDIRLLDREYYIREAERRIKAYSEGE